MLLGLAACVMDELPFSSDLLKLRSGVSRLRVPEFCQHLLNREVCS